MHKFINCAMAPLLSATALYALYQLRAIRTRLETLLLQPGLVASPSRTYPPLCVLDKRTDGLDDGFVCVTSSHGHRNGTHLSNMRASDWVYDRIIVKITDDASVRAALESMHVSKASCALVYQGDRLVGVLDTPDVLRHVLRASSSMAQSAARLLRQYTVASSSLTIEEVCSYMRTGTRHVVIQRESGGHQLVSQRSLTRVVFDACFDDTQMHTILSTTTASSLPSFRRVIGVLSTATARNAFERMAAYGVTSLPIVDEAGTACGVISATDIFFARHDARSLDENVMKFVHLSRDDAEAEIRAECVVSCKPDDDMLVALRIMLHHKVHHVYVLDDQNKPVGIVSCIDILKLLD